MRFLLGLLPFVLALRGCTFLPEQPTTAFVTTVAPSYYLSPTGSDAADGQSPATAWRTLERASQQSYQPASHLYLKAGATFAGNLVLAGPSNADATQPVVVDTFDGDSVATISAATGDAVLGTDFSGLELNHLRLVGNGTATNGVHIVAAQRNPSRTRVRYVEASGFTGFGVALEGRGGHGLQDVEVSDTRLHHNLRAGLLSWVDPWPTIAHSGIWVRRVKAYRNPGNGDPAAHSGSGVILSGVDGGGIEDSDAFENGANNGHIGGGPYGLWCYDAKHLFIQRNRSFNNFTSKDADGGGFDLDGGTSYCVMQFNYSKNNGGPGYALCEFGSPNGWADNVLRWNVSDGDGQRLHGEGLLVWAATGYALTNSQLYNNTFVDRTPVYNVGGNYQQVQLLNSLFVSTGSLSVPPGFNAQANVVTATSPFSTGYHLAPGSSLAEAGILVDGRGWQDFYLSPLGDHKPIGAAR